MSAPVNFYADFAKLTELKGSAQNQDPKALREAARQFESLFTQMMLKSMRQASSAISNGESLMDNDQSDMYREMFDNQMALQLAKGRGLGLADMLVRQLSTTGGRDLKATQGEPKSFPLNATKEANSLMPVKEIASEPKSFMPLQTKSDAQHVVLQTPVGPLLVKRIESDKSATDLKQVESSKPIESANPAEPSQPVTEGAAKSQSNIEKVGPPKPDRLDVRATHSLTVKRSTEKVAIANTSVAKPASPSVTSSLDVSSQKAPLADSPEEFVRQMWPHAQAAARELGVDPKTLIAHAALETGWGKFVPCNPDGTCSFNLFGIKANNRWTGNATAVNTLEYEDGVAVKKRESFRAYDSPADSFRDYAAFIKNNPRYGSALGTGNDAAKFATALQQAGYATDPNYAQKLTATAMGVVARATSWLKSFAEQPLASGSSVSRAVTGGEFGGKKS